MKQMQMKRVLLDTNAISSLFAGDEKVFNFLADAEEIFMSIFVFEILNISQLILF